MTHKTFLVEIGTEELPPKTLRLLAISFCDNFDAELKNADLEYEAINWFATPRRLALKVTALRESINDHFIEKRGPAIQQAFDITGQPSKAAKGWARSCGITLDQAERLVTGKGEWLLYRSYIKNKSVKQLLVKMVETALYKLPIPKLMRWDNSNVQFVRPIHTVTLLLDEELIPGNVLGIESMRIIRGHRFMGETELILHHANDYPRLLLKRGKVIADYEERKAFIKNHAEREATKLGGKVALNEHLLEEVTSMVEWPVVLSAKFEEKFLAIPAEALVHTMQSDQKYFPIYSHQRNLLPYFIFVANIESKDPQQIIYGNEKVIRPRLADAEFFFNIDRKQRLEDYLPHLKNIIFQQTLGTLYEKTNRIKRLATWIARQIGANVNHVARAGLLSKCDLMTKMVFEFSDIQGVMGMHYARYDGEVEDVALALNEQYYPRYSTDRLPTSKISCALALADKMDTLTGIFGIRQYPKGDKDPFALRRSAIGILRIIVEKKLPINLENLAEKAMYLYGKKLTNVKVIDEVVKFILDRFRTWYHELGYTLDTIQAVLVVRPTYPTDFDMRVKALTHFRTLKEATALIEVNKRISNILAKSTDILNDDVQVVGLQELAEIKLASHLLMLRNKLKPYFATGNYQDALIELVTLCKPIDTFFESVMVMTKEDVVRVNRLTLLSKIRELFLQIADISVLQ